MARTIETEAVDLRETVQVEAVRKQDSSDKAGTEKQGPKSDARRESNAQTRREWITALDTIEALEPRVVIAGHKKPEKDDSPRIIEGTRNTDCDKS